jgi:hypothetical protein
MQPLSYACQYTLAPITIDGKLDDAAWQSAAAAQLVRNQDGSQPRFETTARLLWDDEYLYVGFACEDNQIYATMTERDAPLWDEEVVEIFVDANRDQIGYVEIEVNPLNALVDLYVLNRPPHPMRPLFGWDSDGMQHAVSVDGDPRRQDTEDRAWSAEMAIPWQDFLTAPNLPPQAGDVWRINLYRIDQYQSQPGLGQQELYAWSPTHCETFHVPQCFGEIVFIK